MGGKGSGGANRLSAREHRLRGTYRRDRHGDDPGLPAEVPTPPAFLKGAALEEWRRVVPLLAETGQLSKLDRGLLTCWCVTWSEFLIAVETLATEGPTIVSGGKVREHPAFRRRVALGRELRQLAVTLRLAPAKGRVVAKPPEPDEFEQWEKGNIVDFNGGETANDNQASV